VARAHAIRSDRRHLPDTKHSLDQCRASLGKSSCGATAERPRHPASAPAGTGEINSTVRLFSPDSRTLEDVRQIPRSKTWWFAGAAILPTDKYASRRISHPEWRGTGN